MKRSPAKKLQLTKETLRILSNADLRAVVGGTDAVPFSGADTTCINLEETASCAIESDGCAIDLNPNILIGVNTVRRF